MKHPLLICIVLFCCFSLHAQETPFEQSEGTKTATYAEAIAWYQQLDQASDQLRVLEYGLTDFGKPLHLVVISEDGLSNPAEIRRRGKRIVFVNNGIHPGEPCGIDASMMLARDLLNDADKNQLLDEVVLVIIPIYNIGGAFNR
ncbi:MAG: M14 family zinc carboxypeptidase, partial [Bacteroidota bacterium]